MPIAVARDARAAPRRQDVSLAALLRPIGSQTQQLVVQSALQSQGAPMDPAFEVKVEATKVGSNPATLTRRLIQLAAACFLGMRAWAAVGISLKKGKDSGICKITQPET